MGSAASSKVAIVGASGFIGAAVLRERRGAGVRGLFRSPRRVEPGIDVIVGDIRDSTPVSRLLDGVDTLIHCACYIGADKELNTSVNDVGTRSLMHAAAEAGVSRVVYLSTTGVYGLGSFADATEETPLSPVSETSKSRALAEQHVLAMAGTVVRPHLVYGIGDTRVVPAALRALDAMGAAPFPSPLVSAINVRQLASQVWAVAERRELAAQAVNADHGLPVPLIELLGRARDLSNLRALPARQAFSAALRIGASEHQAWMLTADNHFASAVRGIMDTGGGKLDDALSSAWYLSSLGGRAGVNRG